MQPQPGGMLVHQVGEGAFATGQMLGHRDAGVIPRGDDDAVQQVADRHLGIDLDEHLGAAGTPGLLADAHHVGQVDVAAVELALHQVGGHQLGQAGRRQTLVGVVLDQHPAAVGVHENPRLGGDLRRRRNHGLRGGYGLGKGLAADQPQAEQHERETPQANETEQHSHGHESH